MKKLFQPLLFLMVSNLVFLFASGQNDSFKIYSNYDFIPGEKVIFSDDFSADAIGDFPALWNTNGSGEVVTTNMAPGKWFKITSSRGIVALNEPLKLPENYTIEFDVIPQKEGNSSAFSFYLFSTAKPNDLNYGLARPGGTGIRFEFGYNNYFSAYYSDGTPPMTGSVDQPKLKPNQQYRISISVQKQRIRMYVDEKKIFDLPRAITLSQKYNMIRFQGGVEMIGNVRIAAGLPDMRNKLLTEGKLISYGIYFNVNSDKIKPESYGSLKEIATILTENAEVRIKIVGHTDSDGDDASNLDLSKRRAAAVKNALATDFGIDASRMQTDGKGEKEPVAPNNSTTNKGLNRRVEFLKI
ncbi:MAG TPA: OmpA family protein [Chitinophagaceae bacterium]